LGGADSVGVVQEVVADILPAVAVEQMSGIGKIRLIGPALGKDLAHAFTANHGAVFADGLTDATFYFQKRRALPFVVIETDPKLHPILMAGVGLAEEKVVR